MRCSTYFVFCCAILAGVLSLITCELTLIEAPKTLRSVDDLTIEYKTQSDTKQFTMGGEKPLTLGDAYSDSLITVVVPKEFERVDIPTIDWLLTIKDVNTVFGFKGTLMFDSPSTKEKFIGLGSGTQIKTGSYERTDWTPNTLFEFTGSVTLALRLNANGQSTAKSFPGITVAASNEIYTWQDLQAMRYRPNGNYKLLSDIDFPKPGFNGFPTQGFKPIGTEDHPFTGQLTGHNKQSKKNYTISHFFIDRASKDSGLFGVVEGATIKNLTIKVDYVKGGDSVGVLVGTLKNARSISNIQVSGGEVEGTAKVGGLIGTASCPPKNTQCTTSIEQISVHNIAVRGSLQVGGIIGLIDQGSITRSYTSGITVEAEEQVGGMIGHMKQGSIIDSYTSGGTIKAKKQVGGMIGSLGKEGGTVILQTSYAANTVAYTNLETRTNGGLLLGKSLFQGQATVVAYTDYTSGNLSLPQGIPFQVIDVYLCGATESLNITEASGDKSLTKKSPHTRKEESQIIKIDDPSNLEVNQNQNQNILKSPYLYRQRQEESSFDHVLGVFTGWRFGDIWLPLPSDSKTCPTLR